MKILLIGKTGQLGGSIMMEPRGHTIIAPGRDELDVLNKDSFSAAMEIHRPDVVFNTAAFHNVPQCEVEPLRALAVNCVAPREMATLCSSMNSLFVTFSTDYVFDGEKRSPYQEDDQPRPLQLYGISKLAGELATLAAAPNHSIVIRTCGLYGFSGAASKGGNFADKRIIDAQTMNTLEMGCDQQVAPTNTSDLAEALLKLVEHPKRSPGIYHLVNEGHCTWYEFTKAIYQLMGITIEVLPVDRKGMSGNMRRPLYSVLKNTKAGALGITLPHWHDALKNYLNEKYKA